MIHFRGHSFYLKKGIYKSVHAKLKLSRFLKMSKFVKKLSERSVEDEIVISGISGRFPKSRNVDELTSNLFNSVDMTDDDKPRWNISDPNLPRRHGKIDRIEVFDNAFFQYSPKMAEIAGPQIRMLLEHSYEAFIDAGQNLKQFKDSNTGVFVAAYLNDWEKYLDESTFKSGAKFNGMLRCALANRISYNFGLRGPSMVVDSACSSSLTAFDLAYKSINSGECDAAIVGAVQLNLDKKVLQEFNR
jgi:fatty acid synthase, animal type